MLNPRPLFSRPRNFAILALPFQFSVCIRHELTAKVLFFIAYGDPTVRHHLLKTLSFPPLTASVPLLKILRPQTCGPCLDTLLSTDPPWCQHQAVTVAHCFLWGNCTPTLLLRSCFGCASSFVFPYKFYCQLLPKRKTWYFDLDCAEYINQIQEN